MYCYYCGNKIDEVKANEHLLANRQKDEKRRVDFAIQEENKSYKISLKELNARAKKEDISSAKEELLKSHNAKIEELKNSAKVLVIEDSSMGKGEVGISYICPRCGHLIKEGFTHEDSKSLSAASHAELQRGRNSFSRGMASLILGVILGVISFIFFLLSRKAVNGFRITTNVSEFWVFLVLAIISVILLAIGITYTVLGLKKKSMYTKVLKDINNGTFVQ